MSKEKYENKDKKCECHKCELQDTCPYRDRYQRLPRTVPGALGLCKKLAPHINIAEENRKLGSKWR